jgi:hypothetical protein
MGKLKKISIAFVGVIVLIYAVNLVISGENERMIPTSTFTVDNELIREKTFMMMNEQELEELAIPWEYRDMLRNIEPYLGKIIFVEGKVTNTQIDIDLLTFCIYDGYTNFSSDVKKCTNRIFVDVNGITNWLEDDQLSGFVEVYRLAQTGHFSTTTGEFIGSGDYIPKANEIKLTCSNC